MTHQHADILPGTLETMILSVLRRQAEHGYAVARRIEARSQGALSIEEGSLYPALRRLEKRGLIRGDWRPSDSGRRARYYELTPDGSKRLEELIDRWNVDTSAVRRVLGLQLRAGCA